MNISKDELKTVLKLHVLWFYRDPNGKRANLREANLRGANLREADLHRADLHRADLHRADLHRANLRGADLYEADLRGADLRGADLRGADLRGADLHRANLRGADLRGADLYEADLYEAKNVPFVPQTIVPPEEGSFIGWKKVPGFIIKLEIPESANRSSATTRKCRCEFAKVLSITGIADGESIDNVVNENYVKLEYKVGETIYPDSFDDDRWNECSHGIHFFITKQEAIDY